MESENPLVPKDAISVNPSAEPESSAKPEVFAEPDSESVVSGKSSASKPSAKSGARAVTPRATPNSGVDGTVAWEIHADGVLTFGPGTFGEPADNETRE